MRTSFYSKRLRLPFIHSANIEKEKLLQQNFLNQIYEFKAARTFINACVCSRIFFTIPALVASAEIIQQA